MKDPTRNSLADGDNAAPEPVGRCSFLDCTLDLDRRVLRRHDTEVRLRPQTFDVLVYLAAHPVCQWGTGGIA